MTQIARTDDTTGTSTVITKRIAPCTCGCGGQDPWHQKQYTRVLWHVQVAAGTLQTTAGPKTYTKTAYVQLPWGRTLVVFTPYSPHSALGEWFIGYDSMLDAMNTTRP